MHRCRNCEREFNSSFWPRCNCSYCVENGLIQCVFCCYEALPQNHRILIRVEPDMFLCLACRMPHPFDRFCRCCIHHSICLDHCVHSCCQTNEAIRFIHRSLRFAYPSTKADAYGNNIGWLERDYSEGILNRTASLKGFNIDPRGFTINSSRRFAAVELEFIDYKNAYKLNNLLVQYNCSVVEDGSMARQYYVEHPNSRRRNLKPFEINTSPACGNVLFQQIFDIGMAVKEAEAVVSLGCGVHVHIDCRDFGYQELQKVIRVYHVIEEALFAAVHFSRYDNEFCSHCGTRFYERFINGVKLDTKGLKNKLISGVYGRSALDIRASREDRQPLYHRARADHYGRHDGYTRNPMRYSALNLHSYFLRGTVEFRLHHGSDDAKEIYEWAKILIDLFDIIGHISEQKLQEILSVKKSETIGALELIKADKFQRQDLNKVLLANGVVVMRSLLPDETFRYLLNKIDIACVNSKVATERVLPCHLKKE